MAAPAVAASPDTDVDGQPRVVGAASDLGADEFVNQAPAARARDSRAAVRTPAATTFDASTLHAIPRPRSAAASRATTSTSATGLRPTRRRRRDSRLREARQLLRDGHGHRRAGPASAPSAPVQVEVARRHRARRTDHLAAQQADAAPAHKRNKRAPIRFTGSASDDTQRGGRRADAAAARHQAHHEDHTVTASSRGSGPTRSRRTLKLDAGRYELKAYAVDASGRTPSRPRACASGSSSVHHVDSNPTNTATRSRERWDGAARRLGAPARSPCRRRPAVVSQWLVDHVDPQPGQTILELAAGPGDTGLMAAELVGPVGKLISTDASEQMLDVARRRAEELARQRRVQGHGGRVDRPAHRDRRRRPVPLGLHADARP